MHGDGEMAVRIEKKRDLGNQSLLLTKDVDEINDRAETDKGSDNNGNPGREDFRERMMLENRIHGHIPFRIRKLNGKKIYDYNIEGLSSLEEEAGRKLGFELIRALAKGFFDIVAAGTPFLLKEDDYVVTPGTLFFDKGSKELKMIYCPGYGIDLKTELAELMEYCLDMIDYNDERAVRSTYGLYMKLRDGCSLLQLRELVDEIAEENEDADEASSTGKFEKEEHGSSSTGKFETREHGPSSTGRFEKEEHGSKPGDISTVVNWHESKYPVEPPSCPEEKRTPIHRVHDFWTLADRQIKMTVIGCTAGYIILIMTIVSGKIGIFSRKIFGIPLWIPVLIAAAVICVMLLIRSIRPVVRLLSDQKDKREEPEDNETVLMIGSGTQESLILVSDGMPSLCTDKFPCVVGKDEMSCDLVVEAKGVSRKHLRLDRNRYGGVTVEDLNTINGTFLNGRKLAPNMTFEVREGDEISFGSVSYYVNHLE